MKALHKLEALVALLISSSMTTANPVAKPGPDYASVPTGPNMPYDITLEIEPPPIPNQPFVKVRMHEGRKRDTHREAGYAIGSIEAASYSSSGDGNNDKDPATPKPPPSSLNSSSSSSAQTQPQPPSIRIDQARVVHNDAVKCVIEPAEPAKALLWPNYLFSKQIPLSKQPPPAGRITCAFLSSVPPNHVRVELYPPVRERPTVDIPLAQNGRGYVSLVDEGASLDGGGDDVSFESKNENKNMAHMSPGKTEFEFSRAWIISGQDNVACSLINRDIMKTIDREGVLFNAGGFVKDDLAEKITGVECYTVQ